MQDAHAAFSITRNQRTFDGSLGLSRRPCTDTSLERRLSEFKFHKHSFLLFNMVVKTIITIIAIIVAALVIACLTFLCCKVERKHSFVFHSRSDIVFSLPSANIRLISQSRISANSYFTCTFLNNSSKASFYLL